MGFTLRQNGLPLTILELRNKIELCLKKLNLEVRSVVGDQHSNRPDWDSDCRNGKGNVCEVMDIELRLCNCD